MVIKICLLKLPKILAREKERKARTTLLMAIPEDHLVKFHKITDAKEMWDVIKSRFGLHKGYDRFQSLLSQLKIHGTGVSTKYANQKFLRYLPSSRSQVSLIMRTKPRVDSLSFNDLYNNLKVFKTNVKGSTGSSSSAHNVTFDSSESTSSTNDVSTAYGTTTSSGYNSQRENSSSYTDELMHSFFANQSSSPQLDHEDLEQIDEFYLEEMDLKWQVAMISIRLKKFYKKIGRKLQFDANEPIGFDKTKAECFNCHKTGHFARECRSKGNQDIRRRDAGNTRYKAKDNGRRPGKQEEPKALVTLDGDGVDWTGHAEDEQENFALMAYSHSGSDTEVTSCSKECEESYAKLKKLYDEQREQLGDASIEIKAYTLALAKVEAQLVCHQKNQLAYEEKIRFMKIDLDDKTDVLTYHKKLLAEAMSVKKIGLGFSKQVKENELYDEALMSVFDSHSSDIEDAPVYDRFAKVEGMHAVPPPMTGNYMPPKSDFGIDESQFTYGPKQSKTSESDAKTSDFDSCESNSSVETLESVPEPVVIEPKVVSQPKVWSDAPIIEEYESDSDDEYVIKSSKEQETPSFAFVNTVKHVKTPRETVKEQNTCNQSSKVDKRDWNGLMSKKLGLGYVFTRKAYFKSKGTGQGENRLVWNNVQRLNHQNKFVPTAVLIRTSRFPVNTARHNFNSQAVSTSAARKANVVRPIVNDVRQRPIFNKTHSPIKRPFNRTIAPKTNFSNQKVNTARDKAVSAIGGIRETDVKTSAYPSQRWLGSVSSSEGKGQILTIEPQPKHPLYSTPCIGDQPPVTESSSRHDTTQVTRDSLEGTNGSKGDQGRKNAKSKPTLDAFDNLDANLAHGMDYMETEEAVNEGRQSNEIEELNLDADTKVIAEDKGSGEKGGITVSTARPEVDTARPDVDVARQEMKEEKAMEKRVAFKDVEDSSRPARSVLTLKPLPSIDPKDKGKGIQEEKAAQEEASRVAIMEMFDEVQAGIDADALATQRAAEIRSRPPTKSQLKNLMMTYLKNMGGYKHSQLKAKTFEEIQAMYERQKKIVDDFKPMDSDDAVKDSKKEAGEDISKDEEVLKEPDNTRVEVKLEAAEQGTKKTPGKTVKMKARKKGGKQTHADTDAEHDSEEDERKTGSINKKDAVESTKKTFLKIILDEEGIIDFEVLEKRFPIINWDSNFYHFDRHGAECIYYKIFRSDGSSKWIKTFSEMVTRFDRLDLVELYNLNQEGWNLKSWDFYENYGVHILTLEDGIEIHMLAERKYPLTNETLERMTSLKLLAESASDGAYNLLRFIQKQIDETGRYDESEKDL
ncbi:putative ribonuclease H-like domain-containing protein [Tanacetum coccineum]|uniref:Ribonuclease H-like domain-containing protein n=1 Tax=Tanacetum coccineum TaxID=301880 RepID=A0ABQ4WW45_9ASTR